MGFIKIGSGKNTSKLSAWDKFKENKQKNKTSGFDDETNFDEPKAKGPKTNDVDDDFGSPTKPTAPGPKPKPTRGKAPQPPAEAPGVRPKPTIGPVPLPGKPKATGIFDDSATKPWEGNGPKAKPGPGSFGGPLVTGEVPGAFGGKAPASPAIDSHCDSKSGFNGKCCPTFNPAFFEAADGGQAIRIKDGVRPSDAVKDLMGSKEKYDGIASFAHKKAYKKFVAKFGAEADAKFDQKFAKMKIGITPEPTDGPK